MFRFLLGFIYVLSILIKSSKSSSVLASFNESCSNNLLCAEPLICSNTSKCICPKSSSFWSNEQNDCLYCLPGWIEWENNRCLSFAVPPAGGLSYDQANDICHLCSAQLFYMYNIDEFKRFELKVNTLLRGTFSSAVTIFFRLGAWIDGSNIKELENIWCNDNENDFNSECVVIKRKNFQNGSLCLSRLQCNNDMLFICDMAAFSEKYPIDNENSTSSNQRFAQLVAALAPMAINLVGSLLGVQQPQTQTQPQPQQTNPPQIIIQQPAPLSQVPQESDNTLLFVGLGIGGFLFLLIICCACVAIIHFTGCMKNSSSTEQTNYRSSVESGYSYG